MKRNIVLIGLSGSGKSTIGRKLARRLRMPLLDTDAMIEASENRSIPEIFAQDGEKRFRDLESAAAVEAALQDGAVISCGGGMILREQNMAVLRATGFVVFISRHPSRIFRSTRQNDRPLVQGDREKLFRLHAERIALYRGYADYTLDNGGRLNGRPGKAALRVIRAWRKSA